MPVENLVMRRRLTAARAIAKTLFPSEKNLDSSIVANANLVAAIAQGGLDTGADAAMADEVLTNAIAALGALGEARSLTVACHRQLTVVRDVWGMEPGDVGCNLGKFEKTGSILPAKAA